MNRSQVPVFRDVVLAGGGHSHALLLRRWGMQPLPGVRLTLVSPAPQSPYSGMLPGYLAGHYTHDEMHIDLVRLCQWAGVRFVQDSVTGIDSSGQRVLLATRPPLCYDLLSLDTGSTPAHTVPGVAEFAIAVKPISKFLARWEIARAALQQANIPLELVMAGGGAGSVEALLALAHSVANDNSIYWKPRFTLLTRAAQVLEGYPARLRATVLAQCKRLGITVLVAHDIVAVQANSLQAATGEGRRTIRFDQLFWCTQAAAPAWLRESGLALDHNGFVRVGATLQSVNCPAIFAAGDVAHLESQPLPKAGVYAVRQAPVLAANLRHTLLGERLQNFTPQRQFLSLLALGPRLAVGTRGSMTVAGAWVWYWKHRIDQAFMQKFRKLPQLAMVPEQLSVPSALIPAGEQSEELDAARRCNGCGGKLGAQTLAAVLGELQGCYLPEDASSTHWPAAQLLQSIDQLKAPFDDPWRFGRIATRHALNDLFAVNATPHSLLLAAGLPFAGRIAQTRELKLLLQGVLSVCLQEGVHLLGGHSAESAELTLTLTVNGLPGNCRFHKRTLRPGDVLVLGKPLGSGIVLAAHMQGLCPGPVLIQALATMDSSPRAQAQWLAAQGVQVCTDVSGFGLLGHLAELLEPGINIELDLAAIPMLPGALALAGQGVRSSLFPQNETLATSKWGQYREHALWPLLTDPQTSGGLLAAITPGLAEQAQAQGFAVIGRVTD